MSLVEVGAISLLSGFPEPMLVIKPSGTLVFLNPAAMDLLEVSESAEGRNITEFLPEDERSRLDPLAWLIRWADTPDAPEVDYVHLNCRTGEGKLLPVRVRVGRINELDEVFCVVMLQDITLDQSRQQRDRSAHRLASRVLAISSDAVITTDPDLHIRTANVSAEKMFGYGSGELAGLHLNDLLPERYRGNHAGQISQFASESLPARLMGERAEVVGLTRNGTEIPLEASISKVTLDSEVIFSAQLRDLSASKLAAQELARTRASLQTVFDHAVQAMALIDLDGSVLEMNTAARQLLPEGTDPRGEYFATLPFFSVDAATTEGQLTEAIRECLSGTSYRVTTSIELPAEGTRELDFSLTPVMDGTTVFAIVAEARDLLERGDEPGA